MIQLKLASLATQVTTTLLSAAGAAQSSRAETSHDLMEALSALPDATKDLLLFFSIEVESKSADREGDEAGAEPAPAEKEDEPPKVRALYKHEQKNQDGFKLIGFEKGDVLILVKRREDGWSRIKTGDNEGWAPTSYLEDYVEPVQASRTDSDASTGPVDRTKPDPLTVIGAFSAILDGAVEVAKKIQLRDRELAKLSNQIANAIEEKMTAAQQSISDAVKLFQRLLAQSKSTETGRLLEVNTQMLERALMVRPSFLACID